MGESFMYYLLILSISISLLLLFISYKWPQFGRFLFAMLFFWAAYINAKTAILDPNDYLNYASLAWLQWYREFINGFFAGHITAIVLFIASCQLIIGGLLAARGRALSIGIFGAIVFLVAVAPLGLGSGFPSTLIMALALIIIARKSLDQSLFTDIGQLISNVSGRMTDTNKMT